MSMNPSDPASFNHRTALLSTGRTYHFVDQAPDGHSLETVPTILCVHGFPDFWYGWRYQIGPWVRKGYRVVAPDMLGYGGTDKPAAASEYSMKKLCADLAALLDVIGVQRVILVGHDWGAYTAARFALWQPDRLLALVILSVPYVPPALQYLPLEEVVRRLPNFGYQLYLASDEATREIEGALPRFMRLMYGRVRPRKPFTAKGNLREFIVSGEEGTPTRKVLLDDKEIEYYAAQLKSMHGPLSYYRTAKIRFEEEHAANLKPALRADLPVLHFWGTKDATSTPALIKTSRTFIPKLQDIAFEGVGHWIMVEARQNVTDKVLEWLEVLSLVPGITKSKL